MRIFFTEPDMQHPNGNTSIYEVAKELEKKYHLCEKFIQSVTNEIENRFLECVSRGYVRERILLDLQNFIMNLWRNYIVKELHNIHTKAATQAGRKSFIDTGAYYKSMRIVVEL